MSTSVPAAITAVFKQDFEAVKIFSDEDLKQKDHKGRNVVHAACSVGAPDILKYLINERHMNPEEEDNTKMTPAFYACGEPWYDDDDDDE